MEMHRDGSSVHPWPLSLWSDFGSTTLDVLAEGEKRKLRSSRGAELSPLRRDTRSGLRVLFLSVLFPAVGARASIRSCRSASSWFGDRTGTPGRRELQEERRVPAGREAPAHSRKSGRSE